MSVTIAQRFLNKGTELIRYREMLYALVEREVRARYKGSVLGFLWSLLNPLLMMSVYALVFSVYMRIGVPNYALFLFVGLLPWNWFSTSVSNATGTVLMFASLIKKVYFPLEILPLVNVTANLVNFLLSLPILALFMVATHVPFTWNLLFLPGLVVIQYLVTLGFALLLSTLNAFFRDVEQLVGPVMLMWFYLTPVIYPHTAIPEAYRWIVVANPMGPIVLAYQQVVMYGQPPDPRMLAASVLWGVVLFAVGYSAFYRNKFTFSEVV